MKKYLLTLLLVVPSIAFSGDYYITAKGGFSDTDDVGTVTSQEPGLLLTYEDKDLGSGNTFGLSIGKHIAGNFRLELEVLKRNGYTFNAIPNASDNVFTTGDIESSSVFVNALYDFNAFALDNKTITPYIGVGVGISRNRAEAVSSVNNGAIINTLNNHSTNELAYKFSAGMVMSMTQNMSLDISYQYVNLGHFESGDVWSEGRRVFFAPISGGQIKAHELMLGLRYKF